MIDIKLESFEKSQQKINPNLTKQERELRYKIAYTNSLSYLRELERKVYESELILRTGTKGIMFVPENVANDYYEAQQAQLRYNRYVKIHTELFPNE